MHDLLPGNEFGRLGKNGAPIGLNQVYSLAAVVDSRVVFNVEFEFIPGRTQEETAKDPRVVLEFKFELIVISFVSSKSLSQADDYAVKLEVAKKIALPLNDQHPASSHCATGIKAHSFAILLDVGNLRRSIGAEHAGGTRWIGPGGRTISRTAGETAKILHCTGLAFKAAHEIGHIERNSRCKDTRCNGGSRSVIILPLHLSLLGTAQATNKLGIDRAVGGRHTVNGRMWTRTRTVGSTIKVDIGRIICVVARYQKGPLVSKLASDPEPAGI